MQRLLNERLILIHFLLHGSLLAVGTLSGCGKPEVAPAPTPSPAAVATNAPAPPTAAGAAYSRLVGKWQRADGDYTVEIRSAAADGTLDAGYFNPQPINVAKAVAFQEGGQTKVFVELRAPNYPGSTYTLAYDAANDRLAGAYFQAVARETYDVFFVRRKP